MRRRRHLDLELEFRIYMEFGLPGMRFKILTLAASFGDIRTDVRSVSALWRPSMWDAATCPFADLDDFRCPGYLGMLACL